MNKEFQEAKKKAERLAAEMTLAEKTAQLSMYAPRTAAENSYNPKTKNDGSDSTYYGGVGAFLCYSGKESIDSVQSNVIRDNEHHVPAFFANDSIHGDRTTMPTPLAMSCTWDAELVKEAFDVCARETRNNGTVWTFAPMVDIARDPRWGRIVEGFGEDTFLCSELSAAAVKGFQGDDGVDKHHIMACMKHFAAYGACEGGRDYNSADMSEQVLRDVYLPPFKAGVDAGALTFMASFNTINGVPSSGNKKLLTDILRGEWGFEGIVVSDYNGIEEMVNHGFAENDKDAVRIAFNAGLDMLMVGNDYNNYIPELVEEGKISEEKVTESAIRVLTLKYYIGLMDDCSVDEDENLYLCREHREVARKIGSESVVLLENNNDILPLTHEKVKGKKIAVVGPFADDRENMSGAWCYRSICEDIAQTVKEAFEEEYGADAEIVAAKGLSAHDDEFDADAVNAAAQCDFIVAVMGEEAFDSGECASKAELNMHKGQESFLQALRETGKPVITLYATGRPRYLGKVKELSDALLIIWHLGIEEAHSVVDVLCGRHNPSGRLTTSFPAHAAQIPIYYNHLNTGRPVTNPGHEWFKSFYTDVQSAPLYPFGYGKSYSEFVYSDMELSTETLSVNDTLKVSVTVKNNGKYDGDDVVQVYIRDVVASICQPVKLLKGYKKIHLKAGESRRVEIEIEAQSLGFTNEDMEYVVEKGKFFIWAAHNAEDNALKCEFTII